MKRGIVIGKFMPLHLGHMALIEFGASNCDELIVAVCSANFEPIPGNMRVAWVKKQFISNKKVVVKHIRANLPHNSEPSRAGSKKWADYITSRFGKIDVIFSSEAYGEYMADYMGIKHMLFDSSRAKFPVSGTAIRNDPLKYWDYLADPAKPFFAKKVCVYGPASLAKSVLIKELKKRFGTASLKKSKIVFEDLHGPGVKKHTDLHLKTYDLFLLHDSESTIERSKLQYELEKRKLPYETVLGTGKLGIESAVTAIKKRLFVF